MKTFFLLPVILMFCLLNVCKGQAYTQVYFLDKDLGITKESKSVAIGRGIQEDGLFKVDYYGKLEGELFLNAHFVDSSLKILQGPYTRYYKNGKMENQGNYQNGNKDGLWQKWDSKGFKTDSTIYQQGKAFKTATFNYSDKGRLTYYSIKDSLADTFNAIAYDEKGVTTSEAFFKGKTGILKTYDSGTVKLDSIYTREVWGASFPGGQTGWVRYLTKNLNANTPFVNGAPAGTYKVIIKFNVAMNGSISNVVAVTKLGYGMEKEVVRIIENGPAWEPAIQYGRKVNGYRRQPVTFIVNP